MKSFNEYVEEKDTFEPLATLLLENNIDVEKFAELFLENAEKTDDEEVILNELLNTLSNLGRGAMNALGGMVGSAGKGIAQGASSLGQGALAAGKNMAQGAMNAGRAAGNAATAAGSAVKTAAGNAAQPVANNFMQGYQGGQIKQAIGTLQTLHSQLKAMKFQNPEVNHMFQRIYLTLKKGADNMSQNKASRFGVGNNAVWQRPEIPYATAVKSQIDPMASTT